jgi:hypothetical protein
MPTQDTGQPGFLRGAWNSMRDGIRNRTRREVTGARNAVPFTQNWQPQQTVDALFLPGNWYNSQNEPGDRWLPQRAWNNVREGVQGLLGPREPAPQDPNLMGPPVSLAGPDPTAYGPPSSFAQPGPNEWGPPRSLMPTTAQPGRQGQAGRFGTTIAQGPAAVAFARGIGTANSGLGSRGGGGASSYGRDQLNRRGRAMG